MASVQLFVQCGFFVRKHFFAPGYCRRLMAEASEVPSERGRLVRNGVDGVLDETTRSVSSASLSKATRTGVKQRFLEMVREVETHFGVALAGCEAPGCLMYDAGAFFAPHTDTGPEDPPDIRRRRVSAIVFLNRQSAQGSDDTYSGGTLKFHGVLDGPEWTACPLPFEPEPGMLVAFRSDLLHEVQPVTSGRRFTVVTWFLAR